MGSPAGMSDASMRLKRLGQIGLIVCDKLLQLAHLADFLEGADLALLVAVHGQTSRVIASIFQPRKS